MSGNRYFLDTNAIIQLLQGNEDLIKLLTHADYIAVSIISKIEFLSFTKLSSNDKKLFEKFLNKVTVYDLVADDYELIQKIVNFRQKKALKLPDAIIAAKSNLCECILVTADRKLASALRDVYEFSVINCSHS
ncbi:MULTISPECIES: type II toxin-antitoxin system VapC family toxin [Francisella]|uniref:PIN domain-containing protein n=1 Tax=Francisella opportunistica TaxID=2016517 RepID=A0A345JQ06_9GAMM|nr:MULTISPECIES: type II toxin-antitoxin system VapC family toxin [Francisella]APC91091.1 PilT-like protein [Francisella sp. MA067296]AXH29402.1 PIN domain-containing protein [Francisella opportunistica]AXH31054.1 PIN domain-containing protein [Francisella opportunistica]AXH32699.1 PIN domain-containing protein [Francisella opportunistica]